MASKKFDKSTPEWQMFQDYWKICQQYAEPEQDSEYWSNLVKAADDFCRTYERKGEYVKILSEKLAITLCDTAQKYWNYKRINS